MDASIRYLNDRGHQIPHPIKLKEVLDVVARLSEGILYTRVDLHSIEDRIYVGELTFYNECGMGKCTFKKMEM